MSALDDGGGGGGGRSSSQLENIKVAVRLRPFTERERQRNSRRIVDIEQNTVALYSPRNGQHIKRFTFDHSYWSHDGFKRDPQGVHAPDQLHPNWAKYVGQERVFEDLGRFLLDNALEGYNSALLAYGQTGSGKSYTVSGYGQNEGLVPRFARALFVSLNQRAAESSSNRFEVFFSMFEIYNEVVRDLLAKSHPDSTAGPSYLHRRGLKVREHPQHGFFVENLSSYACAEHQQIEQHIADGHLNKSIVATSMNETSSRGHTIYEFRIKQFRLKEPDTAEESLTTSVVQLVDLAGSERMAVHVTGDLGGDTFVGGRSSSPYAGKSSATHERSSTRAADHKSSRVASSASSSATFSLQAQQQSQQQQQQQQAQSSNRNNLSLGDNQQRFKESVSINQSLSALGNCIQVLSQYSQQLDSGARKQPPKIPYRDSVLTKLLNRCCLSGNSKVVIIATLSPADANYDDTLSTLRFADRAKQIRTHAVINRSSRRQIVESLRNEKERLKQVADGRASKSDDSSQTSNFDELESAAENFSGSRIGSRASNRQLDSMATPVRGRTVARRTRQSRSKKAAAEGNSSLTKTGSFSSNPSLAVRDQMRSLVSPARRKQTNGEPANLHKSRSMGQGLGSKQADQLDYKLAGGGRSSVDSNEDELELNDIGDFGEGLISPDSDEDSLSALVDDDMTNDEKITLLNRLLSDSTMTARIHRGDKRSLRNGERLAAASAAASKPRVGLKHVSLLSSSLKQSNPYLSNLNPDEQLTGMISYIIKLGDTVVGKSGQCDVVLHGPELRAKHAKISRLESGAVFIEPILDKSHSVAPNVADQAAISLMVNGYSVTKRLQLHHCDRLRFGTNAYFVFIDNNKSSPSDNTLADLDMVTYDMARNEVLRKLMTEEKNEAMIKEIKDYTHRPGTGKQRAKPVDPPAASNVDADNEPEKQDRQRKDSDASRLSRLQTIELPNKTIAGTVEGEGEKAETSQPAELDQVDSESLFRKQLMEDTYEYAMPVAEVNAVAKEMGIRVNYGLKILTGEEQMPDSLQVGADSEPSSASHSAEGSKQSTKSEEDQSAGLVTELRTIDYLDIPPALYVRVHLEELDLEFYWSKEKFQARRFKILELYGQWEVGGKSALVEHLIDQSRIQGAYLIDPFVDDPHVTPVLIGHAQVNLQSISHLSDLSQSYDILDINDEIVGSISIEAVPCRHDKSGKLYEPFSEEELSKMILSDPTQLLDKELVFLFKIIACRDIPDRFSNVFCQYLLEPNKASVRSRILRNEHMENESQPDASSNELKFDHTHYICSKRVDQDFLNFLQHGFLTIQVVGNYRAFEPINRSPTIISTIISSIQKFKYRMENGYNYSNSAFYNSNSDSAKSQRGPSSGIMNSNSGSGSVVSTSGTVNLFDQQNDDDENVNTSVDGLSQENIIDMILTKRKLDRAENQLHYLKRTVNIAEHYNKKHIPVKTVKKLLNSYGHDLDNGSLEEMAADVALKGGSSSNKHSACSIQ